MQGWFSLDNTLKINDPIKLNVVLFGSIFRYPKYNCVFFFYIKSNILHLTKQN